MGQLEAQTLHEVVCYLEYSTGDYISAVTEKDFVELRAYINENDPKPHKSIRFDKGLLSSMGWAMLALTLQNSEWRKE